MGIYESCNDALVRSMTHCHRSGAMTYSLIYLFIFSLYRCKHAIDTSLTNSDSDYTTLRGHVV